jgi:hypothetical protein
MTNVSLIGSHGSLESLRKMIEQRHYYAPVTLTPVDENTWSVTTPTAGVRPGVRIVLKGKRYRFERVEITA